MNKYSTQRPIETLFLCDRAVLFLIFIEYIFLHLSREISFPYRMGFNLDLEIRKSISLG